MSDPRKVISLSSSTFLLPVELLSPLVELLAQAVAVDTVYTKKYTDRAEFPGDPLQITVGTPKRFHATREEAQAVIDALDAPKPAAPAAPTRDEIREAAGSALLDTTTDLVHETFGRD